MSLHVIILAAGASTRMKSHIPKVLHPICGRPMIAYALDLAAASGVRQPVVVLGEAADEIRPKLPKEVKLVIQQKPLGTGDAVLAARRSLGGLSGDLLILYADTPLLRRTTIQHLIEAHRKFGATCTLLTAHLADPAGYGRIVRDPTGAVVGVIEESEATAAQRAIREINVGPLCAKVQPLFEVLASGRSDQSRKEWYLTQAIGILAKREGTTFQTVRLEHVIEALGVNSRLDLVKATGVIQQRIIEGHLNNGVTIIEPKMTFIDHGVSIGQDTVISPGTVIESGVSIGKRCSIGPFARLRSGVAVADESRIGNFVELVRTKVGARVRVNHVTYLGDTTVEDDVNIGAGTITANFDGTNKLPTRIGKGALIGCDTILIAPVKVGSRAITGAGSVIPKGHDVPPRGVVVGVPARPLEPKAPERPAPPPVRVHPEPTKRTLTKKQSAKRKPVKKTVAKNPRARKTAVKASTKRKTARPKKALRRGKRR